MLAKVLSFGLCGIDGYPVTIEVDICNGLPRFDIVGLGDTAVKEAKERVKSAIKNSALEFPISTIVCNLAPADQKKVGPHYDLGTLQLQHFVPQLKLNTKKQKVWFFLENFR